MKKSVNWDDVDLNRPYKQIAKELGVSQSAVSVAARKRGIRRHRTKARPAEETRILGIRASTEEFEQWDALAERLGSNLTTIVRDFLNTLSNPSTSRSYDKRK